MKHEKTGHFLHNITLMINCYPKKFIDRLLVAAVVGIKLTIKAHLAILKFASDTARAFLCHLNA